MALKSNRFLFALSWPLAALIILTAIPGLSIDDFYSEETPNWRIQAVGQDFFDLFLVTPILVIASILAFRGSLKAALIWAGVILYIIYTYIIYCFSVHFNDLFIIYCLILGLSFYSFIFFLVFVVGKKPVLFPGRKISLISGAYLIVVSILFYLLWLSSIVPATFQNTIPPDLANTGLFTNPVHVIDLSVCLPGLFMIGFFLLRHKSLAILLAPAALVFMFLMDITIGGLIIFMKKEGLEGSFILTYLMAGLAVFNIVLLISFFKRSNISG